MMTMSQGANLTKYRTIRALFLLLFVASLFGVAGVGRSANAADRADSGALAAAEQFPVEGVFAVFWAANGGLTRFGLALSPVVSDPASGGLTVQYFERARFELHPDAPSQYLVQLTLFGAVALGAPRTRGPARPL